MRSAPISTSSTMLLSPISIILLITSCITYAKIYERCELARELRNFDLPEAEIPTWVCIAQHESNYNTSAMNPGSGDHGLFQISQLFWCSPPGDGYGCNSPCSMFRDDDIADDLKCIRRIYNEHTRISGNGFNAWVVYSLYCKNDTSEYVQSCFDQELPIIPDIPINATENEIPYEEVDEYGDGYQFPSLPNFSKDIRNEYELPELPFSRISIHDSVAAKDNKYNFPKFPSSKQSIHEFISVQTPLEKISSKTEQVKQNRNKPFDDDGYNFPVFPSSKHSIHEFTTVHKPLEETKSGILKQNENNLSDKSRSLNRYNFPTFPSSKQSIHEYTTVHRLLEKTGSNKIDKTEQDDDISPDKLLKNNKYIFPIFPSSKQSIHEFTTVHKSPKETVSRKTNTIKHNENNLPIIPTHDNRYNFPLFPASKQSILEFTTVQNPAKNKEYHFPTFPFSKQSIHEFISVDKPLEDTLSSKSYQAEQDIKKSPVEATSDKYSIRHFVPVPIAAKEHIKNVAKTTDKYEGKYSFPLLPKISDETLKQPIQKIKLAPKLSEVIVSSNTEVIKQLANKFVDKPVYIKQSIIHNLPISTGPKNVNTHKKSSENDSKYIFPSVSTESDILFKDLKPLVSNKIIPTRKNINLESVTATSESNSQITSYKTSTIGRPISTIGSSVTENVVTSTQKLFTSDLKPLDQSDKHHSKETYTKAELKSYNLRGASSPFLTSKAFTTTSRPLTNQKTAHEPFTRTTTTKPFSTSRSIAITTSQPLSTHKAIQNVNTQSTSNKLLSTFKSFTTTSKPFTARNTSLDRFTSHSTTAKPLSIFTTISQPLLTHKAIQYFNTQPTSNKQLSTFKSLTTTSKPFTTRNKSLERFTSHSTTAKPLSIYTTISQPLSTHKAIQYVNTQSTSNKLLSTFKSLTTTSKSFTIRNKSLERSTSHSTTAKPLSIYSTITQPSTIVTFKPSTIRNTPFRNFNPQLTTSKTFSFPTTSKPFINRNTLFEHYTSHTTVAKSFLTNKSIITTSRPIPAETTLLKSVQPQISTTKSLTTFKPITTTKFYTSKKTSFLPFTQKTGVTSTNEPFIQSSKVQTSTTKMPIPSQLITTVEPLPNFTNNQFSTADLKQGYASSTTSNLLAKQITFAPDSFFSWVFGSQTLPPLVPPGRPQRPLRPPGDRPGGPSQSSSPLNQRPGPPRPGGLPPPRPGGLPRPPRPDRPGGIRPSGIFDLSESQDLSEERSDFKRPFTNGPLGKKSAVSSPFSSDAVPTKSLDLQNSKPSTTTRAIQQKGRFTTTSLALSTTTAPKTTSLKKIVSSQKEETALDSNKQFPSDTSRHNSPIAKNISNISGRSEFKLNGDNHAVEVRLDDNFVFLRTRFGYRLFRNDKT